MPGTDADYPHQAMDRLIFQTVVRPQRAERLCHELLSRDWIDDLHACERLGSGSHPVPPGAVDDGVDMLPRVLIEGTVLAERREDLIQDVIAIARAGRSGDGKLWFRRYLREIGI